MTARELSLSAEYGSVPVSQAAMDLVFAARGLAVAGGGRILRPSHLLAAMAGSADPSLHSTVILAELAGAAVGDRPGAGPGTAPATPPAAARPPGGGTRRAAADPPVGPDERTREVLRIAAGFTTVTAADAVTTAHLLAAVLDVVARTREASVPHHLTPSAVLRAAAVTAPGPDGDMTFPKRTGRAESWLDRLPPPPVPEREELLRRTPGRRLALATKLLNETMPSRGWAGTPLSQRLARRWALLSTALYTLQITGLYLVLQSIADGRVWSLAFLVPVAARLEAVPLWPWLALQTAALVVAPAPLRYVLAAAAVVEAVAMRDQVWMTRLDRADPGFGLRMMHRQLRRQMRAVLGVPVEDEDEAGGTGDRA